MSSAAMRQVTGRIGSKKEGKEKRGGCCDCPRQLDSVKCSIVLNLSTVTKHSENRLTGRRRGTKAVVMDTTGGTGSPG